MTAAQWWSTSVQIAGVVASLIVAILAIWGDYFRSRLAGPRLHVSLLNSDGEKTFWTGNIPTRFYHLHVTNTRQWAPAKNARVVLTSLARMAADDSLTPLRLSGALQLTWQFPQVNPQYAEIGPDHTCDLGFVLADKGFQMSLYVTPNNFQGVVRARERMRVEVQAFADNARSNVLYLEIAWDGVWSDDTAEMRRHLVVKPVGSLHGA